MRLLAGFYQEIFKVRQCGPAPIGYGSDGRKIY